MYASANFRLKKKMFGAVETGSNFNAGMMVVPNPKTIDGENLQELVDQACDNDTEELLMNKLFRGRCAPLKDGYNVPKRVMHHAPKLWRRMVEKKEIIFLHYMGAKPWMKNLIQRKGADWESERPSYHVLEKVWWRLRRGELVVDDDGTLHGSLPKEVLSEVGAEEE
jgi:lipopolysaccharide biosynthesis glycosyltransferase